MAQPSTELERRLVERINREGPITFRDFMQAALYDPELGYYNTERLKIGPDGDYYTSSNVHSAFGAVLARAFAEMWADAGEPLTLVEMGPGTGRLASDVLSAMLAEHPDLLNRLTYVLVETSDTMRKRQQDNLLSFEDQVACSPLGELEQKGIQGIVFSNEFVDALPVHRVCRIDDRLREMYVEAASPGSANRLRATWGNTSTTMLDEYVDRMKVSLRDEQMIEINLDAIEWFERISRVLERGFLVTVDYGDLAEVLYAPERRSGTVRSFYRHRLIDSPFDRIGEQDITSSVNFTALIENGRDIGFELVSYERQTAFLIRMGLIERIAARCGPNESLENQLERLAVKNLFVPGGVSDNFRVLIQRR